MRNFSQQKFKKFIALSVVLHIVLLLIFLLLEKHRQDAQLLAEKEKEKKPVQWIDMADLNPEVQKKIKKKLQIAHTELIKPSDKALEDARLGYQNQTVKEETQVRKLGVFETAKGDGGEKTKQTKGDGKSDTGQEKKVKLSNLGIAALNRDQIVNSRAPASKSLRYGQENKTSTWFDDVKLGDQTLINTREYLYYGFFLRVQEQFEQHWREMIQENVDSIYRGGGRLLSNRDHKTHVKVVLDDQGYLLDVIVKASSGRLEIDQAAVEAFRKAARFPHPPEGMIEDGRVDLEWTFILRT